MAEVINQLRIMFCPDCDTKLEIIELPRKIGREWRCNKCKEIKHRAWTKYFFENI